MAANAASGSAAALRFDWPRAWGGRARPRLSLFAWLLLAEGAAALAGAAAVILLAPRPSLPTSAAGPHEVGPFLAGTALPTPPPRATGLPRTALPPMAAVEPAPLDSNEIEAAQARIAAALAIARQYAAEAAAAPLPRLAEPPAVLPLALPKLAALPESPDVPAALPEPEPAPAQPVLAAPRIVIHHLARPEAARHQAAALAADLPGAELRAVRASPTAPGVRYFFAADRAAAQALARAIAPPVGGRVTVADFSHYRPLPRQGTLEIWLPRL
jgi:hypothetical protein